PSRTFRSLVRTTQLFIVHYLLRRDRIHMEKVVVSLGGSVLVPGDDDARYLRDLAALLMDVSARVKLFVVTGGGRIARYYIETGRALGIGEPTLDEFGIAVTRLNARLLAAALAGRANREPAKTYAEAAKLARRAPIGDPRRTVPRDPRRRLMGRTPREPSDVVRPARDGFAGPCRGGGHPRRRRRRPSAGHQRRRRHPVHTRLPGPRPVLSCIRPTAERTRPRVGPRRRICHGPGDARGQRPCDGTLRHGRSCHENPANRGSRGSSPRT